jgi:hypothetical protein
LMTSGAGTEFVTGNEWNNKDSFFFFFNVNKIILSKYIHCII